MRRLWAIWGLMFVFLAAGPALSAAPELEPEAAKRLEALVLTAAKLRTVGILDPTRINEFFAAPDMDAPPFDLSTPGLDDPEVAAVLWSYFFRGSQVFIGGVNGQRPVVGYYNPIVDTFLVTTWTLRDGEPAMVADQIRLGETLRGNGTAEERPPWAKNLLRMSLVTALRTQSAAAAAAFEDRYPLMSDQAPPLDEEKPDGRALLAARLGTFQATLIDLQSAVAYQTAHDALADALERKDVSAIQAIAGPGLEEQAKRLVDFPEQLRQSITPLLMLKIDDDAVVVSAAPTQGRFVVTSRLQGDANGVVTVTKLAMIDLYGAAE